MAEETAPYNPLIPSREDGCTKSLLFVAYVIIFGVLVICIQFTAPEFHHSHHLRHSRGTKNLLHSQEKITVLSLVDTFDSEEAEVDKMEEGFQHEEAMFEAHILKQEITKLQLQKQYLQLIHKFRVKKEQLQKDTLLAQQQYNATESLAQQLKVQMMDQDSTQDSALQALKDQKKLFAAAVREWQHAVEQLDRVRAGLDDGAATESGLWLLEKEKQLTDVKLQVEHTRFQMFQHMQSLKATHTRSGRHVTHYSIDTLSHQLASFQAHIRKTTVDTIAFTRRDKLDAVTGFASDELSTVIST